jgi:hypothetical protein
MARKHMPVNPTRAPQLTDPQRIALQAELDGKTTAEAAQLAGVTRQTVSEWRNHNPEYRAARNAATWDHMGDVAIYVRGPLLKAAFEDLANDLRSDDPKVRRQARQDVLRYERQLPDPPPADPDLEADAEMHRSFVNMIYSLDTPDDGDAHA